MLESSALDRSKVFQAVIDPTSKLQSSTISHKLLQKYAEGILSQDAIKSRSSSNDWKVGCLTDFGQLDNPTLMSPEDAFENIINRIDKFFGAPMTHFFMDSMPPRRHAPTVTATRTVTVPNVAHYNMGHLSVTNPSNASDLQINTTAFISNKPITITQITVGDQFTTIGYTGSLQTLPEGNNHTITQQQNIGSNQMITVPPPRNEFGKYRWPGFDWRAYWPQTESRLFADEDDTGGGNTAAGGGNTGAGSGNTVFVELQTCLVVAKM